MEADSGLYTCQLVGQDTKGERDKKVRNEKKDEEEENRAELEINVFRREKVTEEKEEKVMEEKKEKVMEEEEEEEENWKVVHGEKKEGREEDMSERTEKEGSREGGTHQEKGFREEGQVHLSESDRGGGSEGKSSSRVIFQKFQTTDQLKGDSSDIQKDSRTDSTGNLTEPSLKSYRNVTELSLSSGTKSVVLSDAVAQDDLRIRPKLLSTSGGMPLGKSYVLISLCSVLFNNPTTQSKTMY